MAAGSFVERKPSSFAIDFVFNTHDFQMEGSRCKLLADYIAKYMAHQFAGADRVDNLISSVANVLLEAVIELALDETDMSIHCFQDGDDIQLSIEHTVKKEALKPFVEFLGMLYRQDIHDPYSNLLTASRPPVVLFNQMDLAKMVHDSRARIAAEVNPDSGVACTQVRLPMKEIAA